MKDIEFRKLLNKDKDAYEHILNSTHNGVYLYGAGFVGRWASLYFEQIGIPVRGFVDSDERKRGQIFADKPVYSLSDLTAAQARNILISSRHAVPKIKERLVGVDINPISVDSFVVHHAYPEKVMRVASILSHDELSLKTFWAVLVSMLEGETKSLAPYADARPYFDRFGFFNRMDEVFVDAGAYVGDSMERFIWSVNGVFKEIHAFEPGPIQFRALEQRVMRLQNEWAIPNGKIKLINKYLSSKNDSYNLKEKELLTSLSMQNQVLDKNIEISCLIQGITLDSYINDKDITFMKIDVEGSEKSLLQGAETVIKRCRPRIALSIYHYPTDIFELPEIAIQLNQDYQFSLGHHSYQQMETVLYCRDKNE